MFLSALQCALRRTLAVVLAGTLTATGWAQTAAQPNPAAPEGPKPQLFVTSDYSKPQSHFPNPIAPYRPQSLPAPNLSNTSRIDQLMRDGKLYLSINDAVALALENNLDIAIQRYNMAIADTDILRAKAGGSTLGVNSGVVTNTPGGGTGGLSGSVGSGSGGTSAGLGGAGTGAGGLVNSTLGSGSPITSFDPVTQRQHANGPVVHAVIQHFQPNPSGQPEYRDRQLQLPAGLPDRHQPVGGIQQHSHHDEQSDRNLQPGF